MTWKPHLCILLPLLIVLSFLLCACNNPKQPSIASLNKTLMNEGNSPTEIAKLYQLRQSGIRYRQQNDNLTLIVPADSIFQHHTVHLKKHADRSTKQLASFIKHYEKSHHKQHINLIGYPEVGAQHKGLSLSHQYAVVVAGYMWSQGLQLKIQNQIKHASSQRWVQHTFGQLPSREGVVIEIY